MGYITGLLKGGIDSAVNQVKSYDIKGTVKSAIGTSGISDIKIPDRITEWKMPKIETGRINMPAGIESYIPSAFADKVPKIDLSSGINGVQIPKLPDLSSVTSELEGYLGGIGLDPEKLGIRSIGDILENPNLSALKSVEFASYVDLDNLPNLNSIMDGFDLMSDADSKLDTILSNSSDLAGIDITKLF